VEFLSNKPLTLTVDIDTSPKVLQPKNQSAEEYEDDESDQMMMLLSDSDC
jgi:hypothetical protein